MEDYLKRMVEEEAELWDRIEKLHRFKQGLKFSDLVSEKKELMTEQYWHMLHYHQCLLQRLEIEGIYVPRHFHPEKEQP